MKGAGEDVELPPPLPDAEGAVPDGAVLDVLLEAVGYGATIDVGYRVALSVETTLVAVVEAGAAVVGGAEALELPAWVVDAGAAVAAHSQTAAAEDWTARPVTAPQPETTQLRAALAMAADWEAEHWQPKSRAPQPTPEAADWMQEV